MDRSTSFADVLEAVDRLSAEDLEALVEIVRRRAAERTRGCLVAEAREALPEFSEGRCRPATADELFGVFLR